METTITTDRLIPKILQQQGYYRPIWNIIDQEMKQSMRILAEELELGWFSTQGMRFYWWFVARKMTRGAAAGKSVGQIEEEVGRITRRVSSTKVKEPFLQRRGERSFELIADWIKGPEVVDLGCGDGMLAGVLQQHYSVLAADVLDYRMAGNQDLPFLPLQPGMPIELEDNSQDTTILWTVLHHSNDPRQLLSEVARISRSRIIMVEGAIDDPIDRLVNSFYDWYLNRPAKGEDVNVPLNYRTSLQWRQLIEQLGWKIIHQQYLGVDEPVAPERHVLYVLEPDEELDEK